MFDHNVMWEAAGKWWLRRSSARLETGTKAAIVAGRAKRSYSASVVGGIQ